MTDRKSPIEQALDLFFYAPLGLLLNAEEVIPELVEKGRQQAAMARMFGQFAVKQGRDGAYWSDGLKRIAARAVAVDDVVDTTGAGDAFAAGFLSVWPGDREAALAAGVELAAQAVTQAGGRPA